MCDYAFYVFVLFSDHCLWQEPLMGQQPQLQPQEDLPFLLLRIIETIIAATIRIRTRHIIIVAIFSESHANILDGLLSG